MLKLTGEDLITAADTDVNSRSVCWALRSETVLRTTLRLINRETLDREQKARVEVYDISAPIIPLNIVSYRAEHLATVQCFSVENKPKLLLCIWPSRSMNEWTPTGRELRGRGTAVLQPKYTGFNFINVPIPQIWLERVRGR